MQPATSRHALPNRGIDGQRPGTLQQRSAVIGAVWSHSSTDFMGSGLAHYEYSSTLAHFLFDTGCSHFSHSFELTSHLHIVRARHCAECRLAKAGSSSERQRERARPAVAAAAVTAGFFGGGGGGEGRRKQPSSISGSPSAFVLPSSIPAGVRTQCEAQARVL